MTKRRDSLTILALAVLATLPACMGTSYVPTQHYSLSAEITTAETTQLPVSLGIRDFDYARFYKLPMVFRDGAHSVGFSTTDFWAELPRDAFTRSLLDALLASNRFADIGYAQDLPDPAIILTGEVRKFDEVRATGKWTADCEVRFEMRTRIGDRVLWSETLVSQEPLGSSDGDGFAEAMSRAVSTIIAEAVSKITAVEIPLDHE